MENASSRIWRAEVTDEGIGINGSTHAPARQKFQQDLDTAVNKYYQYLREVSEMPGPKPSRLYLAIKRSMDIFVGIVGLILLLPLFFLVSILIKIDSRGPIIFSQERVGKNGKLFKIYKFRTMVEDAESKTGPVWAVEGDPRLTFVGKMLRESKIDEFPQLLNLVKGDMSMVGPRPERPFFVNHFIERVPGYARRLDVIPGITGIAQLRNGYDRRAVDIIHKLRSDISYIENMKLSTDLRILAETTLALLRGKL